MPAEEATPVRKQPDLSYIEGGLLVYTAAYHLKRGHCCGSGCRHCPYTPRHVQGTEAVMITSSPAERYDPGVRES